MTPVISVKNLTKSFRVYKKEPGFIGSIKSLINRKYYDKKAVDDISFEIEEGELVGFIGPNGAGKTTTLKCLSGLIFPTSGQVSILGFTPFDRKKDFLKQISLVMGQKNQLWWDLPPMETFLLNKEIYEVPDKAFKKIIDELVTLMGVEDIVNIQVRKLSLGQRMKCELIAQLIHHPKILFLDEPTIGLDVIMQQRLRDFIREYNRRFKATIILTSHYMEDVKDLCKKVIVIDNGKILYHGELNNITKKYSANKYLTVVFNKPVEKERLMHLGQIKSYEPTAVTLSVKRSNSNIIASKLLSDFPVEDLNIEEPDIQEIIRKLFLSAKHEIS